MILRFLVALFWLTSAFTADAGLLFGSSPQVTTGNEALCSSVPFGQVPANGFTCLNNTFGTGTLVNGTDFNSSISLYPSTFPNGTVMQWQYPATKCATCGGFAYGWPLIQYGSSNYGNGYNVVGPWPEKLNAITTLTMTYNLTLGPNTASFDELVDTFVTASPTSTDGSYVAEISFIPWTNSNYFLGQMSNRTCHTFPSFGEAAVGSQGLQIEVYPTSGTCTAVRSVLSGTVDLRDVYNYVVAQGLVGLTGNEYLRGIAIGPEQQIPASYNSGPYTGSVVYNSLSFNWQ